MQIQLQAMLQHVWGSHVAMVYNMAYNGDRGRRTHRTE